MEDFNQWKEEFGSCFETLKSRTDESFMLMSKYPEKKDEMVNLWKNNILQFVSYTYKVSEKYNNKDVFKAISKALIFGR